MSQLADISPMPPSENPHSKPTGPTAPLIDSTAKRKSPLVVGAIAVAGVLAGAIALSLLSRWRSDAELRRATTEGSVVTFNIVHPSATLSSGEISLPGSAQAFTDTAIYARTNGYLKSWKVDIGAHVKQGDLLAEIETPEVDRQLEQTRADLKNAQANLSLSQINATRAEDLFKTKTISGQEKDQAITDLAGKQALVDAGRANVQRLEQLMAFEKVVAPFDGVITVRNTDVGALIQSSGDSSNAKELFHLADNHILRIYFSVPEVYASTVKHDEEAMITFDAFPGEKFTGTLIRDSAALDPLSHTLNVEADVQNPSGRLFPGGYATVHLKIPGTPGAVTIPANTLLFRAEGLRAGVVREGHVVLVPIEIGHDFGNTLEVLSGLTPQDAVVLDPPDSLADGEAARIKEPAPAKPKP
ncbi:MAG: efflux RND transporter periplasmic adaptor subunit [Chthoniobacter sp.]|uniref:efflux RND transporter periplasmic adaptor subunit n=1 Tax=Chthoniobacter sp. TaxID=2510640 RepID=UPI0032A3FDB8